MKIKCDHCDGTGEIEISGNLSLASLLEPVITDDMVGFKLKTAHSLATIDRLKPLNYPEVTTNMEAFGSVVSKIHGVE